MRIEGRAQALLDGKNFQAAKRDYDAALRLAEGGRVDAGSRARLLSGRALVHEGLSEWEAAVEDYLKALDVAVRGGEVEDPYILNSLGNCYVSLGQYDRARSQYVAASNGFQRAKGFRNRQTGGTTQRLDGAIYAASNAALMLAELGDEAGAIAEAEKVSRRAPNSVDMRAALAALYYTHGRKAEAESVWEFACDNILEGCSKYRDDDWLARVRRWPPLMREKLAAFRALS